MKCFLKVLYMIVSCPRGDHSHRYHSPLNVLYSVWIINFARCQYIFSVTTRGISLYYYRPAIRSKVLSLSSR